MKKMCISQRSTSDRISFLPDAIQSQILSFLPVKDAIKTSILSSQWKPMYSSLSKLVFIQSEFHSNSDLGFNEVIDQVLHAHNDSSIDHLTLIFDVHDAPIATHHQLNEWISVAVSHHVQNLIVRASSISLYTVPGSIFTCTSLGDLQLRNVHIKLRTTTTLCFPRLKTLVLSCSQLTDANFSSSCCPMLQYLVIYKCDFATLSISSSALKHLEIRKSIGHPKINLSIPTLTHIEYEGKDLPDISLETLSSLKYACFWVTPTHHSNNWDLVGKIFKGLRNVRKLLLSDLYVECLRINMVQCFRDFLATPCRSLKFLKLVYSTKSQVPVLKLILKSCPNLQILQLVYHEQTRSPEDENNNGTYWEEKEALSTGDTLNSLKKVHFMYFRGKENEFELIKFLVENATELKKMVIVGPPQEGINEENIRSLGEKLMLYSQRRRAQFEYLIFASVIGAEPRRVELGQMPPLKLELEK